MAVADIDSVDETFQLTTSRRGRRHWYNHSGIRLNISTHDLTKRSTGMPEQVLDCSKHFNSRPHEEVDSNSQYLCVLTYIFQLTTSRRGRLELTVFMCTYIHISTHDLTKRSTCGRVCQEKHTEISTHDLTKRSTSDRSDKNDDEYISTHDLTKRSTEVHNDGHYHNSLFQLTTSRRGRR